MSGPVVRPPGYDGLMERMARKLGLEPVRDAQALGLTSDDLMRLMRRCAACSEPEDCRKKLKAPHAHDMPPTYCPNRKVLAYLVARMARAEREEGGGREEEKGG